MSPEPAHAPADCETDEELDALLDRVCKRYGIADRESAFEFLLRRRLRRGATHISGRGRALHETGADPS